MVEDFTFLPPSEEGFRAVTGPKNFEQALRDPVWSEPAWTEKHTVMDAIGNHIHQEWHASTSDDTCLRRKAER